ncbi:MAG TPA: 4'-phosphopantetheinyl transferase superfamily protein [Methylocella sp.]|nr:4'-phosphopantetheinyl transferase superfamily protein [Methylocella sp.]
MNSNSAPALRRLTLAGGAGVGLWLAGPASAEAVQEQFWTTLSEAEKDRADRFLRTEDRALFVMTRGSLRFLLGKATGIAAGAIAFAEAPFGKPYLSDLQGPQFNVSHSGSIALIGLSESRPIGVDIERMRVTGDELNVAQRFFSAAEYCALLSQEKDAMVSTFYKIWTCKEAALKACGEGISNHLKHFSVEVTKDGFAIHPEPGWITPAFAAISAEPVAVPPGYAGCCALA